MSEHKILVGDCLDRLKGIETNTIDAIVTDPPYGFGFMGKAWDASTPAREVFDECLAVLKPGGYLLAFGGARTYHRLASAIEDVGFEIRDQIMWVYGSGFPKSRNVGKDVDGWDGWGTALKPAHEPIVVARKPLIGTVAANVLAYGTGAMNIDECRVRTDESTKRPMGKLTSKGLPGGGYGAPERIGDRPIVGIGGSDAGRWPANLIHDGSDEVMAAFPEAPGQQRSSNDSQRSQANTYGAVTDNRKTYTPRGDKGSAARFFYCAKATKADRTEGGHVENRHPTVKPTELMRYLCRLVTPPGGTVLDPFMGSGSTGKAALLEGLQFIGIEREEESAATAAARLAIAQRHIDDEGEKQQTTDMFGEEVES